MSAAAEGPDRRHDHEERERVGLLTVTWESTAKHLWVAMALLYLAVMIGGFFLWQAYGQIQDSRREATRAACEASNTRHDDAIAIVDLLYHHSSPHVDPDRAARVRDRVERARAQLAAAGFAKQLEGPAAEPGRILNALFIDALSPVHKDAHGRSTCAEFAKRQVELTGG